MNITTLSTNEDGTLLGADENGELYTGVINKVGYDQLTRVVISDNGKIVEYQDLAGDTVVTAGSIQKANYTDEPHEKIFITTYDQDGNSTGQIEKTFNVVDWTAQ